MNYDVNKRDNIVFGEDYCKEKYMGGVRHFEWLDYTTIKRLMDEDFLDPDDCYNNSPTAKEFADFLEGYKDFTAFGYAISPERADYGVTIEGIESDRTFKLLAEAEEFIHLCRFADSFSLHTPYAWWD